MVKNLKSGSVYALWYRLVNTVGICKEWSDYDAFCEWAKRETGGKTGRFRKEGVGCANAENLKFINDGTPADKAEKIGTLYAAWRRYDYSDGLCPEWGNYKVFYNWAMNERGGREGYFAKKSGIIASPSSVKFIPKDGSIIKEGTVYFKWKQLSSSCILCDEWKDFQVFAKWWKSNFKDNHIFKYSGIIATPETSYFISKVNDMKYCKTGKVYLTWRRIFSLIGACGEWKRYENFYDWYQPKMKAGYILYNIGGIASPETSRVVVKKNRKDDPIKAYLSIVDRKLELCDDWKKSSTKIEEWYLMNVVDDTKPRFNGGYASPETYIPYVEGEGECWEAWVNTVIESEEKRILWRQEDLEWEGFIRNWEASVGK